jgi:hypothetical protein
VPSEFSIPDLLSLLQVDHQNAAIRMAVESARLCRRHRYEEAIATANNAATVAGHKAELRGIALLYLSAARFATTMPDEQEKSARDCTRAIRAFSIHAHNRAIAQIVRAKFELETDGKENQVSALKHLNAAAKTLQALITDSREHQRTAKAALYQNLLHFVDNRTERLYVSLSELETIERAIYTRPIPASPVPPKQPVIKQIQQIEVPPQQIANQSQYERLQSKLPMPTRLLWPTPSPTKVELLPMSDDAGLDYIDASGLSIDGQTFSLAPISGHGNAVRLYAGKQYLAYQVEGDPDQRVLVRSQDQPDQVRQFVVVADPAESRLWIDDAESNPPFTSIHILGINRSWSTDNNVDMKPHIIGVVEAIMTAVQPD